MRPLPELTPENTTFWTSGARGELMIACCENCSAAIHPPQIVCPFCLSRNVAPRAMAGTGTVYTFTVNYQSWLPDMAVPFALAVVDVDGAAGVRVTAPVITPQPEMVRIGQRMQIRFEASGGVWLPLWQPLVDGEAA